MFVCFGSQSYKESERDRSCIHAHIVAPYEYNILGCVRQKPEASSGSPTWATFCPPMPLAKNQIRRGAPRTQSSSHMECQCSSYGFTCSATIPAPTDTVLKVWYIHFTLWNETLRPAKINQNEEYLDSKFFGLGSHFSLLNLFSHLKNRNTSKGC